MFSFISWRAYSQERGESVTRGDRRQRELEFGSPLPPLARSCEYDGAGWSWVGWRPVQLRAKKKS